jgi:Fur family peroxide stress response transcriptional regulator
MKLEDIRKKLTEKGLKVTPQRIAVLESIVILNNHPTAENIIDYIRKTSPNIAIATVYKILDVLVVNEIINKVKTERDIMRYDAILENHHHLYCSESDRIEDFVDPQLNEIIEKYLEIRRIPDFKFEEFKLQIRGKFLKNNK